MSSALRLCACSVLLMALTLYFSDFAVAQDCLPNVPSVPINCSEPCDLLGDLITCAVDCDRGCGSVELLCNAINSACETGRTIEETDLLNCLVDSELPVCPP